MANDITFGVAATGVEETKASLIQLQQAAEGVAASTQRNAATNQRFAASQIAVLPHINETVGAFLRLKNEERETAISTQRLSATMQTFGHSVRRTDASVVRYIGSMNRSRLASMRAAATNRQLGFAYGMVVNELSEFTFALGTAIPAMRQMGTTMAMAGNSAMGMGMRLGPIGVALGVLTGAIPALISALSDTASEMDAVGDSAQNTTRDILQLVAAMRQQANVAAAETRVAHGRGTVEEQEAHLARARLGQRAGGPGGELGGLAGAREGLVRDLTRIMGDSPAQVATINRVRQQLERIRPGQPGDTAAIEAIREQFAPTERRAGMTTAQMQQSRAAFNQVLAANDAVAGALAGLQAAQAREALETTRANLAARAEEREAEARRNRRRRGGGGRRRDPEREAREAARTNARELREFAMGMGGPSVDDLIEQERLAEQAEFDRQVSAMNKRLARERFREQLAEREEQAEQALRAAQQHSRNIDDAATTFADAWRNSVDEVISDFDRFNEALESAGITALDTSVGMQQVIRATWNDVLGTTAAGAKSAIESALTATLSGEEGFADAIRKQTKVFIQGVVARSTVAAIEQGALALADLAIGNATGAALHGAAAAQYAAVAGVAATVGYATGSIGTAAKEPEKEKKAKTPKRDELERRDAGTVVINVGTFPVSTQADVGRAVRDALRASDRRDGRS